jgi:hypothetical protein
MRENTNRLVATVLDAKGTTKHYVGLPPELNDGKDNRVLMPVAAIVLIELGDGDSAGVGDCMLYRFTLDGSFVGDTWHETLTEAKAQADFEYVLSTWREVPSHISNVLSWIEGGE